MKACDENYFMVGLDHRSGHFSPPPTSSGHLDPTPSGLEAPDAPGLRAIGRHDDQGRIGDRSDADELSPALAPVQPRHRSLALAIQTVLLVGTTSGLATGEAIAAQITPNNNTGTIPVVDDDFNEEFPFINGVGGTIEIDGAGTLTNRNGGLLDNYGAIDNSGTLNNNDDLFNEGVLNNSGTLSNNGNLSNIGEANNLGGAGLTNNGYLYNGDGSGGAGSLSNRAGSSLTNNFIVYNYNGSTITNAGSLANNADLYNDGDLLNAAGGNLLNSSNGTLNNLYAGLLTNRSSIMNDGRFFNDGTLDNESGGSIDNRGGLGNYGSLINRSGASLTNSYQFVNYAGGSRGANGSIINEAGATLTNALNGILENDSGDVANAGTLRNRGYLHNAGTLENQYGGSLDNDGDIVNAADWTNAAGGELDNSGTFANLGNLVNNGGIVNTSSFVVAETGSMTGAGSYTQSAGETLVDGLLEAAVLGFAGGEMAGNGTYKSDQIDIGADVAVMPGASVGAMTFSGDTLFNGDLFIEVTGVGAGLFDLLDVTGFAVDFGPDASIAFEFGYLPVVGASFEFLLADSVLDWSGLPLSFTGPVGYSIDGLLSRTTLGGLSMGVTSVAAVPVPSPLALLSFGLAGAAWYRRLRAHG